MKPTLQGPKIDFVYIQYRRLYIRCILFFSYLSQLH